MKKAACLTLCLVAPSASPAQESVAFVTPSGNIQCVMSAGEYRSVTCELRSLTPSYTDRPADCDLDYGASFRIGEEALSGEVLCAGDTIFGAPNSQILPYGYSLTHVGVTCQSEMTGLTCKNAGGHGFFVSKARQQLF
ncbi:MAG: hypothetical protein K9G71_06525 [Rhodobacteraceae bacterium]|nr:hypothetical protein [Paracoccaceae bacterium]MCF8513995.1 hypothetical protein [Paracoccaceae bacterium]MCF8518239.1 hypothetical protein [Paracoccaceae bacterium]